VLRVLQGIQVMPRATPHQLEGAVVDSRCRPVDLFRKTVKHAFRCWFPFHVVCVLEAQDASGVFLTAKVSEGLLCAYPSGDVVTRESRTPAQYPSFSLRIGKVDFQSFLSIRK